MSASLAMPTVVNTTSKAWLTLTTPLAVHNLWGWVSATDEALITLLGIECRPHMSFRELVPVNQEVETSGARTGSPWVSVVIASSWFPNP